MARLQQFSQWAGKITEKAVCRSVFLTIPHCIFSAELTKNALI